MEGWKAGRGPFSLGRGRNLSSRNQRGGINSAKRPKAGTTAPSTGRSGCQNLQGEEGCKKPGCRGGERPQHPCPGKVTPHPNRSLERLLQDPSSQDHGLPWRNESSNYEIRNNSSFVSKETFSVS